VLNAGWQRCRVHFTFNALAHVGKSGRGLVSVLIVTAFAQDDAAAASDQCLVTSPGYIHLVEDMRALLSSTSDIGSTKHKEPRSLLALQLFYYKERIVTR
jgi:hypothetical protein